MKLLILLFVILSASGASGCSTMKVEHGKFYITSEALPVITNDKNYRSGNDITRNILLHDGKITYQIKKQF